MSSESFAERILRFVGAGDYEPREVHELAETMGIGADEVGDFHAACKALVKTGRVVLGAQNALTLPPPPSRLRGQFRANPRGFGFVIPDERNSHGDLFVPPGKTEGALTGDTVEARVLRRGKRDGKMVYEGCVVEIVQRGESRFVGELMRRVRRSYVIPDGNTLHVPIFVGDPGAKGAQTGDQVVVEVQEYPSEKREARGVIVKVLGPRGDPDVETLSIIEQHGLPGDFPAAVLRDARKAVGRFDPEKLEVDREDLQKLTTLTIDPDDARDFDDAISVRPLESGLVELGVHIADVAHFVREGGVLDTEARWRSNSIYLPRAVIPMLPELLSNGVCSLQEREPRLTKSAFLTYDRKGNVKKVRFANTIIRSSKRLTYDQASAILGGRKGRIPVKVVATLQAMEKLAKTIHRRRVRKGMLELDLPDIELVFDKDGRVVDVAAEDSSFPHKMIEMFMVEANEAVSRKLSEMKIAHLRRVHDTPRPAAALNLIRFIKMLGYELPENPDRFDYQALLKKVKGREGAFAVNLSVLRSMQAAEYAPVKLGHYALASDAYCHFTSPIRRYPDLLIHRALDRVIRREKKQRRPASQSMSVEELAEIGKLCTQNERRAEAAERELKLVLLLRLLEAKVGERFEGIVTGVANMGLFVQLRRYLIDGLLRFELLGDDWWEVDVRNGCVVGERSGRRFKMGDRLDVVVTGVSLPTRQVQLAPSKPVGGSTGSAAGRSRRTGRSHSPQKTGRAKKKRSMRSRPDRRGRSQGRR